MRAPLLGNLRPSVPGTPIELFKPGGFIIMRGYKEASIGGCLSSSLFIHCGAVAAVALISTSGLIADGTVQAKNTVEFTIAAPKGQQTKTLNVGPMKKVADNSIQTKKVIEQKSNTIPTKVAPAKPAPKAPTPPQQVKAAPMPAPVIKATPVATVAQVDTSAQVNKVKTVQGPSPIEIQQAQELMKKKAELDTIKKQQQEAEQALKAAEQQRELENKKAAALLAAQEAAQLAADQELKAKQAQLQKQNQELENLKNEMAKQAAQMQAEREAKEAAEIAAAKAAQIAAAQEAAAQKAAAQAAAAKAAALAAANAQKNSNAQSNLPYGVPSGTRSYQDLVQAPGNLPPIYPEMARLQRKEGAGRLIYFVNQDGSISQVKLLQSSGYTELDNEAINKISQYRYRSGQAGWTYHDYIFSLKGQAVATDGRLRQ